MSGSLARAAPIRFLVGVTLAWTAGRGVALAGWQPDAPSSASPAGSAAAPAQRQPSRLAPNLPIRSSPTAPEVEVRREGPQASPVFQIVKSHRRYGASLLTDFRGVADAPLLTLAAYVPSPTRDLQLASGLVVARSIAGAHAASRLSGSAWAFVRGGARATALSPVGQIGGGQAGARLLYAIDRPDRLSLSARVSRTIGGITQTEAAAGLDWKPLARLPVHLMVERRIAIDKGGRNAWTLGAAGGVDDVRIAPGWRLDGYGEAGVVGAHRRDLYADGAARIARAIDLGGGRSLSLGGGAWGVAQPRAARLDIGPSAVLRAPVAGRFVAVALDWRERVAGDAKPGSGIALTVAADF